jgi:hypothetical protein
MPDWGEKLYAAIEPLDPYLDDQVLIVSGLYLSSFLILDVPLWKACVVTLVVYICQLKAVGRRSTAMLSIPLFAVAMAKWTDIAGFNELAEIALHGLHNLAQR